MGKKLDLALGILNGVVGDYLARTGNGLATEMELVHRGRPLRWTRTALAESYPRANPRVVILLHGVTSTETIWQFPDGRDYGSMLERDFGSTPLYLRYNSGVSIAENGALFAELLGRLVSHYPVPIEEIIPLGYSMGGLVVRSACHVAQEKKLPWLPLIRRAFYIGTPHLGAPLERIGRLVTSALGSINDPYTRLVADIGNLRSDGIRDLGFADLRPEDRHRSPVLLTDPRHPVPLLDSIQHYLIAGSLSSDPRLGALFGDALVPVGSGTFGPHARGEGRALPPSHIRIVSGVGHIAIASNPEVYRHIHAWCEESP